MTPTLDFRDRSFRESPHGIFTDSRKQSPYAKVRGIDAYVFTRHAECEKLLKDSRIHLDTLSGAEFPAEHPMQGYFSMRRGLMLFSNALRHKDLRAPAAPSMNARAMKRYEGIIRELAQEALSGMEKALSGGHSIDFVKEVSLPYVSKVICRIVGMPDQDHVKLARMTQAVADGLDPLGPRHSLEAAGRAYAEFQQYMSAELARGRWKNQAEEFSHTFLGEISQCPHMLGGFKNEGDLISTTVMLLSAGHLTTNHSLSLSVESILGDSTGRDILTEQAGTITPLMIEELFRYHCPAQITRRSVKESFTIAGKTLPEGQAIWLALVSANRDEAVFQNGQQLDFHRKPNPHLSFGGGVHFCLGAHLARLQLRVFLEETQGRFPRLEVEAVERDNNVVFRGLKSLKLRN